MPKPDPSLRDFSYSINGIPHKRDTLGNWVVDREASLAQAKREQHKRDLFWALRSRILTESEMEEVTAYGDSLNIGNRIPYDPLQKAKELNEALLQQFKLRQIANQSPLPPKET